MGGTRPPQVLSANRNALWTLPDGLDRLTSLVDISIAYNNLTSIPGQLFGVCVGNCAEATVPGVTSARECTVMCLEWHAGVYATHVSVTPPPPSSLSSPSPRTSCEVIMPTRSHHPPTQVAVPATVTSHTYTISLTIQLPNLKRLNATLNRVQRLPLLYERRPSGPVKFGMF